MKAEYLIGKHEMPEGMSAQDLVDFLMQMTPQTRRSSYVRVAIGDALGEVSSIDCAQSDQAEAHELKLWIVAKEPL
jgi:hypothetical protein